MWFAHGATQLTQWFYWSIFVQRLCCRHSLSALIQLFCELYLWINCRLMWFCFYAMKTQQSAETLTLSCFQFVHKFLCLSLSHAIKRSTLLIFNLSVTFIELKIAFWFRLLLVSLNHQCFGWRSDQTFPSVTFVFYFASRCCSNPINLVHISHMLAPQTSVIPPMQSVSLGLSSISQ